MQKLAAVVVLLIASLQLLSIAQSKAPAPSTPPASGGQQPPPQIRVGPPVMMAPPMRSPLDDMMLRNPGALAGHATNSPIGHGVIYAPEASVPKEPMREFRDGLKALKKKDAKAAEQHFQRATELYPRFSSAFNLLGIAYEIDPEKLDKDSGRNEFAKSAFQQSLTLNPGNHEALANLGHLLLREHDHKEAERLLRLAVAIQPGSSRAVAELMLVHAIQKQFDEVISAGEKMRPQGEHDFPIVYFLRAVAWESKSEHDKAVANYREYLKKSPATKEALFARAALARLNK